MTGKPRETKRKKRVIHRRTVRTYGKKTRKATSKRTRCHRIARSKTRSRPTRRRIKTIRKMRNRKPSVRRTRCRALSGGASTTHLSGRGYLAASGSGSAIKGDIVGGNLLHGAQESRAQSGDLTSGHDVSAIKVAESDSNVSGPMIKYAGELSSTQNTADPEAAGIQFGSTLAGAGVITGLTKVASSTISKISAGVKGLKGSETDLSNDAANTSDVEGAPTASDIASGSGNGDDSDNDGDADEGSAGGEAADSAGSIADSAAEAGIGFLT